MPIPTDPYNPNVQYPYAYFADQVLLDVAEWEDGDTDGVRYYYDVMVIARHWCTQELECLKEFKKLSCDMSIWDIQPANYWDNNS
jgi:hypothetical protein